jgi:7-cyano-7-deazaguanine reductase
MTTFDGSPLGKSTSYPDRYDASLLFAVPRAPQRAELGIHGRLPFSGCDIWNAYELTWLDVRRVPQLAVAMLRVRADSPAMVESKSLKLYLGSFAQEILSSAEELRLRIADDLGRMCGDPVVVELTPGPDFGSMPRDRSFVSNAISIDACDVTADDRDPDRALLTSAGTPIEESLRSSLFRSTCPVTGQPDYADVFVRYRGARIEHGGLLRYLVSYRRHAAFHEACVERIFVDVRDRCRPQRLSVYARFMRRGGIDINPFRSDFETEPPENLRTPRQ